ncbi:MAG: MotA/TolQ/ExbB proton channel family protein [Methylomonas sp.]|jgi:biopolymer transport protein ExbB|uniref:MotA/TolQ/ExbB proton channel family protein n=1 Tax=Methylomonas sp. TaxID=418 RepID=UPI0025D0B8C7|nr:MotA/TolQ/ExbB proton channel family protein [Methylomonas sp.]MCK9608805.1 MotA/TolQ/ExbB proton channel family protein [Methylomonas sp.]
MEFSENYFDEYVLQGGITMLALLPLSIVTLGIIVQRFLDLRSSRVMPGELIETAGSIHDQQAFDEFRERLPAQSSPLARVILDYIEAGERGEPTHPDVNPTPIDDMSDRLYQSLSSLSTAYVIAPLIGVLGTTVGIMGTFEQFSVVGKRDMSALVSAIDKSLITTMWGLIIAVPAYYFYALLRNKIFFYERDRFPHLLKRIMKQLSPFIRTIGGDSPFNRIS